MKPRIRFRLVAGLLVAGAITACVVDPLNPQPLPPGPPNEDAPFTRDAGLTVESDAGVFDPQGGSDSASSDSDGGALPTNPSDAGVDVDAGDADAGDADANVN